MTNHEQPLPERNDKALSVKHARGSWRRWWWLAALLLCAWWLLGWLGAYAATAPHPAVIQVRRTIADRTIQNVEVRTCDDLTVRAWLVDAHPNSRRCVLLASGIRGNRHRMVTRAEFYLELGWSVLLVDLRGTGNSDRARISMGWHEALDLIAWYDLLQERGYQAIGVHGQSLGAAAAAYTSVRAEQARQAKQAKPAKPAKLAKPAEPQWSFLVLEACYRDIDAALRARTFSLPSFALLPMIVSAEWLLDLRAEDLNPVAAMRHQAAPLLLACGTSDDRVGADATALLMAASTATDKVRHDVLGAGHVDLWSHSGGSGLRAALRAFLSRR